jgi:hypothetical protein
VTSYSPVESNESSCILKQQVTPETFVPDYTESQIGLHFLMYYYEIKIKERRMDGEHDASLRGIEGKIILKWISII